MSNQTPKAFDFGEEPDSLPQPAAPKAFDFGEAELAAAATAHMPPKAAPKPLFDSEDHPAVRDAMGTIRADYPALFEHSEQRMTAMFRRILPVRLALVTDWAEAPLAEQAALLRPMTALVRRFAELDAAALLSAALESTKAPTGVLGKLFGRSSSPAQYKPGLMSARTRLQQFMAESEGATSKLDASAKELTLHWVALAVVADLAGGAPDATLLDVLQQRRTLIQQAVRQAELSMLQMGQVRQQAADLIGQISSFLSVTLPAIEMAQAQGGPDR